MILTPDQGYKGTRVQIYEPPPLPPGTLTLNPSGVTKPLPFCRSDPFDPVTLDLVRFACVAMGVSTPSSHCLSPQGYSIGPHPLHY